MKDFKRVCILGLGYIGLPTAAVIAKSGMSVAGVDINPAIVDTINQGKIHIFEPELEQIVHGAVTTGYLKAFSTPQISDVYLIVVPTPFTHNYEPDISFVEAATASVIPLLKENDLFIIESTSPVGTTDKMREMIFKQRPELQGLLSIAYCPERVLPGNTLFELINNDRVIGGADQNSSNVAKEFYSKFVKGNLYTTNSKTAEMCKLVENASRDSQIAFANELSIICDKAGIDVWELIELANKHPRVKILKPGCGVGGHCIAVDPYFLIADYPKEARMIASAREVNNYKAFWCLEKMNEQIDLLSSDMGKKPTVAIMGITFKPDIDDIRESPALSIAKKALRISNANILIADPYVKEIKGFSLTPYETAFQKADLVVFLVAHAQFKKFSEEKNKKIIDCCGITRKADR